MKLHFKSSAVLATLAAILAFSSATPAWAAYPDKPIKLIVPFPAGGPTDGMARLVGQHLSQSLGQAVIIDNRGGAGGTIATEAAATSAPDGYTLFFATTGTMAINPSLYRNFKVDPVKAFEPVGSVAATTNVLVVASSFPANSVRDLISLAKQKPGVLTYGSAGNGSSNHISGELFKSLAGIDITHVPYKGSAAAFTDMLGGQISMMFDTVSNQVPQISGGKAKPLGVTGRTRSAALPNVPTIAESGLSNYEVTIWFGLAAPKGTPADIVNRVHAQLNKMLADPEVKSRLASLGAEPLPGTPQAFATMIQQDTAKWSKVVKASGATID